MVCAVAPLSFERGVRCFLNVARIVGVDRVARSRAVSDFGSLMESCRHLQLCNHGWLLGTRQLVLTR
uniref:Uncharacterized protein n=1 Tax=Physcomitrium patens TaxID=3218 RepID=A0A7I3ZBD8_PHYPA